MCFSQPWLGAPQQPLASLGPVLVWLCWLAGSSAGTQTGWLLSFLFLCEESQGSVFMISVFSLTHRCSRWFRQDRNPSSAVVHLHLGERDHHPPPPAHA